MSSIYRPAALAAHQRGDQPGRPLHVVSSWTRLAVGACVAMLVAAFGFAAFARVGEYAEGVAVIRRDGREPIGATVSGAVQRVEVAPGQVVAAGQLLVQLDDRGERAELERVEQAYELRLVELLREPEDPARHERLATLASERQLAAARVHERAIVAPHAGVISDVRVRPGAPVQAGDVLLSIEGPHARTVVVGLFPGRVRPLLHAGDTRLLLELDGFPDAHVELSLASVADEVIGPEAALQGLGRDQLGALALQGPLVRVEAELAADVLFVDDVELRLYDGMHGRLEARLRARTLLESLMPTLADALEGR